MTNTCEICHNGGARLCQRAVYGEAWTLCVVCFRNKNFAKGPEKGQWLWAIDSPQSLPSQERQIS